jgi:hypothetical protein
LSCSISKNNLYHEKIYTAYYLSFSILNQRNEGEIPSPLKGISMFIWTIKITRSYY